MFLSPKSVFDGPRSSKRPNHFAHCTTTMCKCCEDARGFKINSQNTMDDTMIVYAQMVKADLVGRKRSFVKDVINAYVWGVLVLSFYNVFQSC
ncbi:hypothetical protein BDV27DRAFT_120037 [Aspergillus caelatus]|uniref:Uncharacterized protein n=1 Tax=Aspergillus caelatus TaxID=61420 RepID=A0A5N7AM82_9EURO|nr:uncharacterized protein BDV27DRAFT_120037 [Aspergillus caelatus]KAE8370108.1 hypothetical protein BDV27DRAFT_120037 [Aspergillus caelatus]